MVEMQMSMKMQVVVMMWALEEMQVVVNVVGKTQHD